MIEEKFEAVSQRALNSVEGIKRTGLKIIDLKERYSKTLMPLEGNVNHVGMMYAGSLFTIGEFSGGIIHLVSFDINRFFPIVKEISIRFRRPALTDVTLEVSFTKEEADSIQAEAEKNEKADFTLDLEIKDQENEIVSIVNGVWQIRKIPEGMDVSI
ncbi:MAG: YiiD C-terminal domain-containing protein [Deltaproteobacteria bacterium]|nr:YiiD C-terminal domain-containing protein [Deltaproteobacteria bacterium]